MARHDYTQIKTDFVRRELRRTHWKDRGYINTLMIMEAIFAKGGAKSMGEGLWLFHVGTRYPMALHAIKSELKEGKVLSDEELAEWMAERRREEELKEKRLEEETRRRQEEEEEEERRDREDWLAMGGLP